MIDIEGRVQIDENELVFNFSRSSGPGGQNVNKVSSRVEMRWDVENTDALDAATRARLIELAGRRITRSGELLLVCGRRREQAANRRECVERLTDMVRRSLQLEPPRVPTRPSKSAKAKRMEEKVHRSRLKKLRKNPSADD